MANNNAYIALSAAAAITLAGASYQQISAYETAHGVSALQQSVANCPAFQFSSWGDPHISTTLDGQSTEVLEADNLSNFSTVDNTDGGATKVSTDTEYNKTQSQALGQAIYDNKTITITHGGSSGWTISAAENGTSLVITLTDKNGTRQLQNGSSVVEPDGSTIMMQNGSLSLLQSLQWGGALSTSIAVNTGGVKGISVYEQGRGTAVATGYATNQATGSNAALLPCMTPGGNPSTPSTPNSPPSTTASTLEAGYSM